MSSYERIKEVKEAADFLTIKPLIKYKPNMKLAKWNEIIDASTNIGYFLTPTAIKLINNAPIEIVRDPLRTKTMSFVSKNNDKPSVIVFPTFFGREDYKPQIASFYGLATGYQDSDEYGLVLSHLYEYLYFLISSENPIDEFALRNLTKKIPESQRFLEVCKNFFGDNRTIERSDLEKLIKVCLQSFSSLEISLQLIEQMNSDSTTFLEVADEIIQKKKSPEEIIKSKGLETTGYKTLKKTIDRFRL
ncbi:MAG: hypothetical protein J6A52_07615 [Bacilli bacterium]|nr:hypothetical protein [Bacilli bacterium]